MDQQSACRCAVIALYLDRYRGPHDRIRMKTQALSRAEIETRVRIRGHSGLNPAINAMSRFEA
jgi:hypothetical protein